MIVILRFVLILIPFLAYGAPHLIDVTEEYDLDFTHSANPTDKHLLPEIMGSGAAIFDADNDGDLDFFFANYGANSKFYVNESNRLIDRTEEAGLLGIDEAMGVSVGDIDNDGDIDIFITRVGTNYLFENQSGYFVNVTRKIGINNTAWSTSAAFCDLDLNGQLDLYVTNYVLPVQEEVCTTLSGATDYCPPNIFRYEPDQIMMREGPAFVSIDPQAFKKSASSGLGVACLDLLGNSRPEILVANDGVANQLWTDLPFTPTDSGLDHGIATNWFGEAEASMWIALGDINNDLIIDILMTHIDSESDTLYVGSSDGPMLDLTATANLVKTTLPHTGFGTAFADLDNDGDLDILTANGRVRLKDDNDNFASYGEPNSYLINNGQGRFSDACESTFCQIEEISRGLIAADIDKDGDLDVIVTNNNAPARIYRNILKSDNHWIVIHPIENQRIAVGSRIYVHDDNRAWVQPVQYSSGYLTSQSTGVHFGLGDSNIDVTIVVEWPDGFKETFKSEVDRHITVYRDQGEPNAQ